MHRAAYCGHGNVVTLLVRGGGEGGRVDSDGRTPLHKVQSCTLYSNCCRCTYCIPRKYNVPLIITNLTSALNSLKFVVVNVLRYAHVHVKHVKNRYHKGTLKWQD